MSRKIRPIKVVTSMIRFSISINRSVRQSVGGIMKKLFGIFVIIAAILTTTGTSPSLAVMTQFHGLKKSLLPRRNASRVFRTSVRR